MKKETLNKNIKIIAWNYVYKLFTKLPLDENKVFFESFLGQSYSDNPKALYEKMISWDKYKFIWSVKHKQEITGNAKQVKRLRLTYFYHLATAKYLITNSRMPNEYQKRDGQVYIQTWHGTPLKRLGHDIVKYTMPNTTKEKYLAEFDADVKKWDYLISPNMDSTKNLTSAFKYNGVVIEKGYPRNDYLQNYSEHDIRVIKNRYQIREDEKVLLYTPTYRDNKYNKNNKYTQQMKLDLATLQKKCPKWKIIVRMHYLINDEIDLSNYKNVIIPKNNVDICELMIISDCLLTDYSSVMFDYSILNRPMIFYAYDLPQYQNATRGFYENYHKIIPGENIKDTQKLVNILKNMKNYQHKYAGKLVKFNEKYCNYDDGNVANSVLETIFRGKNE